MFLLALLCMHRTVVADNCTLIVSFLENCTLIVSFLEKTINNAMVKVFLPDKNDMNPAKQSSDCPYSGRTGEEEDPFCYSANSQKS
jgi:hypothetical protein